jgi:hypothetical protein
MPSSLMMGPLIEKDGQYFVDDVNWLKFFA